jgi:hypothetical protein
MDFTANSNEFEPFVANSEVNGERSSLPYDNAWSSFGMRAGHFDGSVNNLVDSGALNGRR